MGCMCTLLFSFVRSCRPVTKMNSIKNPVLLMLVVSFGAWASYGVCNDGSISFNRDVRPILAETCFHCHGPDEDGREAGLRLDLESGASEDLGGYLFVSLAEIRVDGADLFIRQADDVVRGADRCVASACLDPLPVSLAGGEKVG